MQKIQITKLMQTVAMDDEVLVKQEGDPPNSQGVLSVAATVHWDDDEVEDVMLWHHEHDPPAGNVIYWRPYDGFGKPLSYIDRACGSGRQTTATPRSLSCMQRYRYRMVSDDVRDNTPNRA